MLECKANFQCARNQAFSVLRIRFFTRNTNPGASIWRGKIELCAFFAKIVSILDFFDEFQRQMAFKYERSVNFGSTGCKLLAVADEPQLPRMEPQDESR